MRTFFLACLLNALAGCNAVLGLSETSLRAEGGSAGQMNGSGGRGGGAGGASAACTTNADCLQSTVQTEAGACISGKCVKLWTPECPLLLPQTENLWFQNLRQSDPEPVILGAFLTVPSSLYDTQGRIYDLALTELSRAVGGIPAAGGKRRPVVVLGCRNLYPDSADLDRAVDHLMEEVRVPGILAGLETKDLDHAFRRGGSSNHVFFMSPLDSDRSLIDLPDDGLVWHMLPGGEQLAPTYGPLLTRTLEHLRRSGQLGESEPARVALVTAGNVRSLAAMSTALSDGILKFNGGTTEENTPEYFRAVSTSSIILAPETPDYTDAIQLLEEFSPHVIVSASTREFLTAIIPALEADATKAKPFYLLSPWHIVTHDWPWLVSKVPMIHTRVAGVNFAAAEDSTAYEAFQARFNAAHPAFQGDAANNDNYYDAAYYLLYAAAAAPQITPLVGYDILSGMRRLLSGRDEFGVGPNDLLAAFTALETPKSSIVLNGTMGPPSFDPRTGARNEPGSVWCVDAKGNIRTDVLRLDAKGNLKGEFPCFDFAAP